MNSEWLNSVIISFAVLLLFATGEFCFHILKWKAEVTRKIVHIGTGFITFTFPWLFKSHWFVLMLSSSFFLLLIFSKRFNFLKSINSINRESLGSFLYPVIIYICFYIYNKQGFIPLYYYLPILTMAICDPSAAFAGKYFKWKPITIHNDVKTISGLLGFIFSALLLMLVFYVLGLIPANKNTWMMLLVFPIFTAFVEFFSIRGTDNLSIPLSALLIIIIA